MKIAGSLWLLPLMLSADAFAAANADTPSNLQQLIELHERQRIAHLQKDASLLMSMIAEDFVSISDGAVDRLDRNILRRRFERYFAAVEFLDWSDISPPEISISDDATMATVVVRKRVRLRSVSDPESPIEATTFAWLEVWQKRDGRWLLTTIASTDYSAAGCSGQPDQNASPNSEPVGEQAHSETNRQG